MFKNIILGLGIFAAVFAVLIFSGKLPIGTGNKANTPVGTVVMWGTLPQNQVESFLQAVNATTKTYRISYNQVDEATFSPKLLEALASGGGPDLILVPYQIILEQRNRIYPFPLQSMSQQQYRDLYVDGMSILFSESGALGLPISISPLMLFYNHTLFSNAGLIDPPTMWDEIAAIVPKLTVIDVNNRILQSAIALGSYTNIPAAKDIIMTFVAQLGQVPVVRNISGTEEKFTVLADTPLTSNDPVHPLTSSLRFFTQFSDPGKATYTWSPLAQLAQDQFVAEKLAMYVGYSDEEALIRAKNPRLDIGVKSFPQSKGHPTIATGMKVYAIATLKRSTNLTTALTAQYLLTSNIYGAQMASIAGGFSPLKSILSQATTVNQEYIKSILVARGWYDINANTSSALLQATVNDILSGRRTISESGEGFVRALTESYTR